MTASRILILHATLALTLVAAQATAADPPPEAPPQAPPDPTGELTLDQAVALALMHSPDLETFSWEVRAGEARAIQAGAVPNPELDLRVLRMDIPSGDPDELRSRAILTHEIELGGRRARRVDLARAETRLAELDYETKRAEVVAAVSSEFVAVLGAQREVDSLARCLAFFEDVGDRVRRLVESGSMREVEVHRVARRVGMLRIDVREAEARLASARSRLAALWGGRRASFERAAGDLEQVPPPPPFEAIVELAPEAPEVTRWEAELARGEAALGLARARRAPDLRYGVGVRWERDLPGRDYLVDFEIGLPIFDRKRGEILEARHEMDRARAGRQAAEAAHAAAITERYEALVAADAGRTTLRDEVLPAARATLDAFRHVLQSRPADPDDLLDARRDVMQAEVLYAEALVGCHRTRAELESLVGRSLGR